jgi:cytochrome P450
MRTAVARRANARNRSRPRTIQGVSLPPGPALPAVLQTLAWITRPGPFMERARRRYGDPFTVRLEGVGNFVFVSDPAALKQIFTADPEKLRSGKANAALEPVLGSRSLLLLDGREHLRQRKLMLPPFHGERLRRYEQLMAEIAAEEVDRWPTGEPIPLQPRMQAITLEIILRVVFGYDRGAELTELRDRVVRLLETSASPMALFPPMRRRLGPWSPWTRFLRAREKLDEALFAEIARRRGDERLADRDDIFSMLVQARDEDGEPLTDRELRDELVTLLIAGHETTATALAWAFERLMRLPGSLDRLADEEYAEAAVTETLRLRPPLPVVARWLEEPYEVLGHELPAGTRVAPCIWLAHRRADVYPDPYAFRPERFIGAAPDTYAWLPFGGGVRRCIGASFATLEMRVVLQTVAERVRLEAPSAEHEHVSRRAIILAPARGGRALVSG